MKDNIVTYADLECPSVQLKCILEEVICSAVRKQDCLNFEMAITPTIDNTLTISVGNTTHTVNLSAICNTLVYTNALKPVSGTPGQIIYVSDVLATDGSTGTPMIYQTSTTSWKKLTIS